jgi:hypothetical protein
MRFKATVARRIAVGALGLVFVVGCSQSPSSPVDKPGTGVNESGGAGGSGGSAGSGGLAATGGTTTAGGGSKGDMGGSTAGAGGSTTSSAYMRNGMWNPVS